MLDSDGTGISPLPENDKRVESSGDAGERDVWGEFRPERTLRCAGAVRVAYGHTDVLWSQVLGREGPGQA